jgi:hypothetical protein
MSKSSDTAVETKTVKEFVPQEIPKRLTRTGETEKAVL